MGYWLEIVQSTSTECTYAAPVSEDILAEAKQALGIALPDELLALWRETNGIRDKYGDGIWSAEKTIRQNLELRSFPEQNDLYMSFEPLLCFADAGNGDLFFFPIQAGGINRADVFKWDHESDSRVWAARNLRQFVEMWHGEQIQS